MKNLTRELAFLFLFAMSLTSLNANTLVDFKDSDLNQIKNQGKKILISFTAEWCTPCKIMDESIYSDREIAKLINENFIAIKADVDSESGNEWNELYNANYLPTTIFTLETGNEIERLNGTPTRDEFLGILKKVLAVDKIAPRAIFASNVESKPIVAKTVVTETIVKETISKKAVIPSSNYSIQLGAFYTTENAQNLIDNLNKRGVGNTIILEESTNGRNYHKVILPGFNNESEAKSKLQALKQKGLDGFIKKL